MPVTNYHSVDGDLIGETTAGVRTDYLADALGSVEATADASATLRNRYARKPYGAVLARSGPDADPAYGFVGELGYRETRRRFASHYVLARHYDEITATWTSVDPLWPRESAYLYVEGNPATWVDPSGSTPLVRPRLPRREDYIENCCEAMKHPYPLGLYWFYQQVRGGGPWDYKQRKNYALGYSYEDGGNYNYGFAAACSGIPKNVAQHAAGQAQILAGTSKPEWRAHSHLACLGYIGDTKIVTTVYDYPYGDDPKDQKQISSGYDDAIKNMDEIKRKCRERHKGELGSALYWK